MPINLNLRTTLCFISMELPKTQEWFQNILFSYRKIFKVALNLEDDHYYLVSHAFIRSEAILVYGNANALSLWEMSIEDFRGTPSKYTAEEDLRSEREKMLKIAAQQNYYQGYHGVRISATGKRFYIKDVCVFNVFDIQKPNSVVGQAALFKKIQYL